MALPEATPPPDAGYAGRDLEAMAFAGRYHAWIRDEFADAIAGDVAEVGAGDGAFSRLLLQRAPRSLTLFEPCAALFARQPAAFEQAGVRRRATTLARERPRAAFDTLVYVNVLEHIEHDGAELAHVRDALRPGGRLCLFVPALPWLMSAHDRRIGHWRRYGRAELHGKVARAGFEIERLHWFDAPGVIAWGLALTLLDRPLDPRAVARYDRWVVPWLRRLERRWRPPLGKNLLLVARCG